jgi:predicted lipoprotein with Yx(FWY)xxD motif
VVDAYINQARWALAYPRNPARCAHSTRGGHVRRLVLRSAAAAAALLLLTAACGGGGDNGSAEPAGDSEQSPAAASTLETAESDFGSILVDSEGMTLYMFDPDEQGPSVCDAGCLQAWPIVEGPADAGQGVDDSMLGTTESTEGTTMATYNDWPLYYFVKDKAPGDVTGQGDGGVWWVIGPDGQPVREKSQASGGGGGDDDAAPTLKTASSEFGRILVDAEGMTLYMFDPDKQGRSVCDAGCLEAWPPFEGPATAGKGVDDSMLGTTQATDGSTMATYNDWPLYYWVKDKKPGDVTGQAVEDVWWVMGPNGKPIRQMPQGGGGG